MDFSSFREERDYSRWEKQEDDERPMKKVNLAPLKGALETDPVRSKILKLLINDGGWVTTTDLLNVAKEVRKIIGAVTIGMILTGLNEIVASKLILSRTSLNSGIEWAEWRLNPDYLEPTRVLLRMLERGRLFVSRDQTVLEKVQKMLEEGDQHRILNYE